MFRIVCCIWGSSYNEEHITKLQNSIICSTPYTFHVFREFPTTLDYDQKEYYRGHGAPSEPRDLIYNGYYRDDMGGIPHYRKLFLFSLDEEFDENDIILYIDLDSKIVGDLAYFYHLNNDKPWIIKNYWWEDDPYTWKRQYHLTRCPLYNSSVLRWVKGQNRKIIDFLIKNKKECFFTYPSIDTFMFHQFGPYTYWEDRKDHFQFFDRGIVTSERVSPPDDCTIIHTYEGLTSDEKNNRQL